MAPQPQRKSIRNRSLLIGVVTMGLVSVFASAGDLAPPPGAIQPTDRVTINPQAITLPFTISQPGSYVLTGNIVAPPLHPGDGIVIMSSDVTLDLNGFALIGVPSAIDAVKIDGSAGTLARITVKNGTASGGWNAGFALQNAEYCRALNLTADGGASNGLLMGRYSIVDGCVMSNFQFTGISIDAGCVVTNSIAHGNQGIGINGDLACVIKDCNSFNNQGDGIRVTSVSVVENCSAMLNGMDGIDATDSLVRGCATGSNLGLQINDNGGSCTLVENH